MGRLQRLLHNHPSGDPTPSRAEAVAFLGVCRASALSLYCREVGTRSDVSHRLFDKAFALVYEAIVLQVPMFLPD